MGTENSVDVPSSSHSECRNESKGNSSFEHGPIDADIQPNDANKNKGILDIENLQEGASDAGTGNSADNPFSSHTTCRNEKKGPNEVDVSSNYDTKEENMLNIKNLQENVSDAGTEDNHCILDMDIDDDVVENPSIVQVSVELTETATLAGNWNSFSSRASTEISPLPLQDGSLTSDNKTDSISGVKRVRVTFDEQQPPVHVDEPQSSIHVVYNSLPRDSKRKLQELLQQWSEWHTKHRSPSQDPNEVLESGEETYFPALRVGVAESSAVSFWVDNQTSKQHSKEFVPLDSNSVPLYDRGYALGLTSADGLGNVEGGLEIVDDASRCFNCGSYNHPLRECPKPRDNVTVNNARKQLKSRRNHNSGSRNPTRYYQNTPGGKYDGLRPGALDAETRKLLGIGELDPPPWFNRMREIGYPPGYLDEDEDHQPSGIIIFADEEAKEGEEEEDGEIIEKGNHEPAKEMPIETDHHKKRRKMSVKFPGINVPIPENADERLWEARSSTSDFSGNRPYYRSKHSSEPTGRIQYNERRWSRDDGPPGVDTGVSPYLSSYSPRYNSYESARYNSYESPRYGSCNSTYPSYSSDRGRWSPRVHEESRSSEEYKVGRTRKRADESQNDNDRDRSPRSNGMQDDHHHRGWR